MLNNLLYFQFAFLYLLVLNIGLVVYGSDFKGIAGWIYVLPLILLAIVHKRVWSHRFQISSGATPNIISGIGAIAALVAYAPMHMGYWDEHSVWQAVLIAVLGVCSYVISIVAATRLNQQEIANNHNSVLALGVIGFFWLLATQYPLAILLCLAVLFVIAAFWLSPLQATETAKIDPRSRSDVFAKYAVFLAAIDISCVVWDFEVNSRWAWYVAAGFFAAAVGYYIGRSDKQSDQLDQAVYATVILNFMAAVLWPNYILWFLHVGIAGFCLGYLLPAAIYKAAYQHQVRLTMGWVVWFFLGVALSNAWYANLAWAFTRVVLLLPFAVIALLYLKYRYSARVHHA